MRRTTTATRVLVASLLLNTLAGCSAPELTLQIALDERGAATAWVRSGHRVLVLFLDPDADASVIAPFLADPAIGSAIAQVDAANVREPAGNVREPSEPRLEDVPAYFASTTILPQLTSGVDLALLVSNDDDGGSISVRTPAGEWLLYFLGPTLSETALGSNEKNTELIVHPARTDHGVQWIVTTALGSEEPHSQVLEPGQRLAFSTTARETRHLFDSLITPSRSASVDTGTRASTDDPPTTTRPTAEAQP